MLTTFWKWFDWDGYLAVLVDWNSWECRWHRLVQDGNNYHWIELTKEPNDFTHGLHLDFVTRSRKESDWKLPRKRERPKNKKHVLVATKLNSDRPVPRPKAKAKKKRNVSLFWVGACENGMAWMHCTCFETPYSLDRPLQPSHHAGSALVCCSLRARCYLHG